MKRLTEPSTTINRRTLLSGAACMLGAAPALAQSHSGGRARIAITLDLEMSRHYPRRGMTEWDYEKGNLDKATKEYSLRAAALAQQLGAVIHFFLVARVLEHPNVEWIQQLIEMGHSIGNHTYDHVNVKATTLEQVQFRFRRAPWLAQGKSPDGLIRDNIALAERALQQRLGKKFQGFRTPGGFTNGLDDQGKLQRYLLDRGYRWVSSKYPSFDAGTVREGPSKKVLNAILAAQLEAQPYRYPSGLIEIPMSPISDVHAFRSLRWKLPDFLRAIEAATRQAIEKQLAFDFLCHPSCMLVEDPDLISIRRICQLAKEAGDRASICSLDEIAAQTPTLQQ